MSILASNLEEKIVVEIDDKEATCGNYNK
jgi:hypothetical protein